MGLFMALALVTVVVRPVANMYSGPSRDTDVVSQAIYGANVGVVEEKAGWVKIRTPDDYTGWTPAAWLRRGAPYAASGRVAQVASLFANLYREADVTKHEPVITVPFEARLEVAAEPDGNGRWIEVKLADGRRAWVQRGDVEFDSRPMGLEQMIAFSRRFLGIPYLWGGTSTYGYDCSGFVQMLYRRLGVLLPRDAQPQAQFRGLEPVERLQLKPGDLLYFGPGPDKIRHTGMYLGNGEFINATTHERPMVRVDRLDEPPWTETLVACRRLK
jgi:cell wall-associated NlpC family hydrolase